MIIITILDNLDKNTLVKMPFVKIASCRLKALHQ
nr:MAG TPA: cellulose biosynthesis protein [Caudoviricetes sp.]